MTLQNVVRVPERGELQSAVKKSENSFFLHEFFIRR